MLEAASAYIEKNGKILTIEREGVENIVPNFDVVKAK